MQVTEYFEQLFQKKVGGIKVGLERMEQAYQLLGRPADQIPKVLIGGTNGKGTTSGFLYGLLKRAGVAAGLYSSPHLVYFSERYQLSHGQIHDDDLHRELEGMKKKLPTNLFQELSFFEIATLLAFLVFEAHSCEFIILEVGLGGRWDATNITDPIASAIISVSRDHEIFLGSDLKSIAREKLGIARPARPLFWGEAGEIARDLESLQFFHNEAVEKGALLWSRGRCFERQNDIFTLNLPGVRSIQCRLPLAIQKQAGYLQDNFLIALAMYHWLVEQGELRLASGRPKIETLIETLDLQGVPRAFSMIGRFQLLKVPVERQQKQTLILDVCHNPDGVRVLKESLDEKKIFRPPVLVSILKDKKVDEMLDQIRSFAGPVFLFQIDHERTLDFSELALRHRDLPQFDNFLKAWQHALELWHNFQTPWLICGSVLAVGRVLDVFNYHTNHAANDCL